MTSQKSGHEYLNGHLFMRKLDIFFSKVCHWFIFYLYRVFQRFRLTLRDDYFWVNFDHFWCEFCFWGSWGSIKDRLEPKNQTTITKFSLSKSVKRSVWTKSDQWIVTLNSNVSFLGQFWQLLKWETHLGLLGQ